GGAPLAQRLSAPRAPLPEAGPEGTQKLPVLGAPGCLLGAQQALEPTDAHRYIAQAERDGIRDEILVARPRDRQHEVDLRALGVARRGGGLAAHDGGQCVLVVEVDEGLAAAAKLKPSPRRAESA